MLEGISPRITETELLKLVGRQKDGNHCFGTERRMKEKRIEKDSLADLWDNIKHATLITGVPKRRDRERT